MKIMPDQNEVNVFLDVLRASGVTNMFGAGQYIQEEFGVNKRQASNFLKEWMRTFKDRACRGEVKQ